MMCAEEKDLEGQVSSPRILSPVLERCLSTSYSRLHWYWHLGFRSRSHISSLHPGDTGGTPMIHFDRSQGHARHQVQSIIGVPACVPTFTDGDPSRSASVSFAETKYPFSAAARLKSELKGCAGTVVRSGPKPTAVSCQC
jgi:hypothetical protein